MLSLQGCQNPGERPPYWFSENAILFMHMIYDRTKVGTTRSFPLLNTVFYFISQPALPETSDWLVLQLMLTRAVWRCATMECGEQCAMISGEVWMQV